MQRYSLFHFVIVAFLSAVTAFSATAKSPNVVIVIADDQAYGDLGSHRLAPFFEINEGELGPIAWSSSASIKIVV